MRSRPPSRGRLSAVAAILVTLLIALPSVAFAAAPLISTSSLPAGQVGASYSQTLAATDGTAPYTWAITAGGLPAGLTLNASTGVISGTPSAVGTSSFTAQVTDAVPATGTKALSITVAAAPVALAVSTASVPAGQVGVAYSQTVAATGGTAPYSWAVISGGLPAGISLNTSTGVISGTPTAVGASSFTLQVNDAASGVTTKALSITIAAAAPSLTISTASVPAAQVGVAYTQTMAANGGSAPYTWSVTSGSLPTGLTLSAAGVLSGTPTVSGLSAFTIQVADSASHTATATYPLNITAAATLVVSTNSLPGGVKTVVYSQTLGVIGGVAPYSWSISSGVLPPDLSLNTSTGLIEGTPSATGTYNFVVLLSDGGYHVAMKSLSINVTNVVVTPTPTPTPTPAPTATPTPTPKPKDDRWDDNRRKYDNDHRSFQDYFYGQSLNRGDRVSAYINGLLCGTTIASRSGQWSILIRADARCRPQPGSPVAFTLNGVPATASPTAEWRPRGLPLDTYGYTLTPITGTTSTNGTASFSGGGLTSGSLVAAYINGTVCASATVSNAGMWSLSIVSTASCAPTAGATVGFTVGGNTAVATPAATWQSGGNGTYSLVVGTGPTTGTDLLPYQAYGSGLTAGATVLALNHGMTVATAMADSGGNWVLDIPALTAATGDVISFSVNGAMTSQTVTFEPGGFVLPPGLALTAGTGTGTFSSPPNFGTGKMAQVVFTGGTVAQLDAATSAAGGTGAWVQDSTGAFRLLIVGAPAFLRSAFEAAFPVGFTTVTGVTVTRS